MHIIIPHSARQITALRIAFSGFLALAVVMGIGRFAFTPQVPLMIDEHQLNLTTAGIVAACNYPGHLAGSFDTMRAKRGIELRFTVVPAPGFCCADWRQSAFRRYH